MNSLDNAVLTENKERQPSHPLFFSNSGSTGRSSHARVWYFSAGTDKSDWQDIEGSAADSMIFDVPGDTQSIMTLKRPSSRATTERFVRAFLDVIDLALTAETSRKLIVYQSIIDALKQKITEIEQLVTYEKHELPHITSAFLMAINRPPASGGQLPIYTDEELNRF